VRIAAAVLALALVAAGPLAAQQDSVPAPRPDSARAAPADSAPARPPADSGPRPPVTPMGAFWRSLLVPGWGQATLGRKLTGGMMVAWEGVTLGMTLKTSHELAYFENTHSSLVAAKEQERQDWIVLLAFNHLFSALEAYVSAHLWDFPPDLRIEAVPHGVGAAVSLPLPHR
jgi:hypothetical protein